MAKRGFLCSVVCLLSSIAVAAALRTQGDALHKFFDLTGLQRAAVGGSAPNTRMLLSDLTSKIYNNEGLKEKDRIIKLPGQPRGVDFHQYGGYVTVDGQTGRALFYYFAEAVGGHSSSKPLLLWLNGGPGCSSLGLGAMAELGPFRVMSDGKTLYRNPYAWNTVANVLFLESPAGVGFSYSNTTSDYNKNGDQRTAEDAYVFLLNWMERFPEYKGREFYIAGQSYAGHYVPQLAYTILFHNHRSANATAINLKGIAIGNAVINDETDSRGMVDFLWTHALISDATVEAIHKYCNFSPNAVEQPRQCIQAFQDADPGDIDSHNIYAPLCFSSGVTSTPRRPSIDNFDPCTDIYVDAYLNDPEVQEALHANVSKLSYPWSACRPLNWTDTPSTILPIIKQLLTHGLRVWVYSGDVDGVVPVTSTRYSLKVLKLSVRIPWRYWTINKEVGGYTMVYDGNLTFATIRGAGHSVPSYQPARALVMISTFLRGLQLPP